MYGRQCQKIFAKNGIKVYYGAKNTAQETLDQYNSSQLSEMPPDDGNHHYHHHDH